MTLGEVRNVLGGEYVFTLMDTRKGDHWSIHIDEADPLSLHEIEMISDNMNIRVFCIDVCDVEMGGYSVPEIVCEVVY